MDSYHKILSFPQQFSWKPEKEHTAEKEVDATETIAVCGMGGSALAGDIIRAWLRKNNIIVHRDFHLPSPLPKLVIAISYSGNTEETLSCATEAREKNIPIITIAAGGKLEAISHETQTPFIKLPANYQPREALGFMIRALAEFIAPRHIKELEVLAKFNGKASAAKGKKLAEKLFGTIPLIYTSSTLAALGYNWKIKLNETGKNPAFAGIIPEIFHNEMTGFDMGRKTRKLARNFSFVLLEDTDDAPEIKNRMRVFKKFMESKGFMVAHEKLAGTSFIERFIRSINLADWTSYFLAHKSGADPENVPWVEEFKKLAGRSN
ncbi:MAG: bifunctional phosphoglucose/phosphomannose isomerase [Candidatus Sungbacteria bacterium]|nr:bifunctional phosphoglucose/phosphomannose isomerase [Candidatus Sungbacteria bacterium]